MAKKDDSDVVIAPWAKDDVSVTSDPIIQQQSKDTVTVIVPKDFQLRMNNDTVISFKAGVCEMTQEQIAHWYTVANGVTVYSAGA